MSSVEALGMWLSECPRPSEDVPSVAVSLPLDGVMDRKLRYLSARFGLHRDDLTRELLRAALRDTFAMISSDPIPSKLLPDIHDAGLDPEEYRWFDLDGVGEDEGVDTEPDKASPTAPENYREENG